MENLFPSLVNALVVAIAGVLIWYVTRGQHQALTEQIQEVKVRINDLPTRAEVNARFEAVDVRLGGIETRLSRVESEGATLRSDLTQIALAVGAAGPRPQTG